MSTVINLTYLLSDALATEWMMTIEACHALKQIYLDALKQKEQGSLRVSDIEKLWAQHEAEGIGQSMHMLREEEGRMAVRTEPMKDTNYTQTYKNIAIIDIIGPIVPRVRGMSSGSVGAQQIKNDFITAFERDDIKGIMLNVDSPGGDARGISELAQTIQKARNKNTKPIYAYAAGWMASAAYFISAAAHRIVANDWASLGSIGVVIGVPPSLPTDNIEFVSTVSPYKRPNPSTDDGKKIYQDKADFLGQLFIEAVADLRGVTIEKVVNDFGRGSTLVGKQAKQAGLADAIGTFDSTLHSLVTAKPLPGNQASSDTSAEERSLVTTGESVVKEFGAGGLLAYKNAVDAGLIDRESSEDLSKQLLHTSTLAQQTDNGGNMAIENGKTTRTETGSPITAADPAKYQSGAGNNPPPAKTDPPATEASAPPTGVSEESAEIKELRAKAAEADKLKAQLKETLKAGRAKDAEMFAGNMIIAKKVLPAAKEKVEQLFVQCAEDDEASPLASGSRLETYKTFVEGLPVHTLTTEFMQSDLPDGAQILNPDAGAGASEAFVKSSEEGSRNWAKRQNSGGKTNLQEVRS